PDVAQPHRSLYARPLFRRQWQNADNSLHRIVYIGEVAPEAAPVIELNDAVAHDRINEFKNRHIWAPPRTIDCEKPQSCGRNVKEVTVSVGHNLVTLLGAR